MKKIHSILIVTAFLSLSLTSFRSHQIIKTQLHLTIRDELGNTVEGATVKLYETEDDYTKETNHAAEGVTDAKGIVKFKELKAIAYYVLASKDDINNFGGGEQTGKLEPKRINKATIVIQ